MSENKESTLDDVSPLFQSWSTWYGVVIICNIITIGSIYLYFQSI